MSYTDLNLQVISPSTWDDMVHRALPEAPWAKLARGRAKNFIHTGLEAGVPWQVHPFLLDCYLQPRNKTSAKRQEKLIKEGPGRHGYRLPDFKAGVGLLRAQYLGGYTGTHFDGSGENEYRAALREESVDVLAPVLWRYWPDVPPLIWEQVKPLLVQSTQEVEHGEYGATREHRVDRVDALNLFHFLEYNARLDIVEAPVDWAGIIDPTARAHLRMSKK